MSGWRETFLVTLELGQNKQKVKQNKKKHIKLFTCNRKHAPLLFGSAALQVHECQDYKKMS